jgi:hypothetical protein
MRSNCMLGHHVGHMLPGDRTEVDLSGHEHANGSAPGRMVHATPVRYGNTPPAAAAPAAAHSSGRAPP